MNAQTRLVIMLVKGRELREHFERCFSSDQHQLVYANGHEEALALGSQRGLRLVVLPLDQSDVHLAAALRLMGRDSFSILGVAKSEAEWASVYQDTEDGEDKIFDQVVVAEEPEHVVEAARTLLSEHRRRPRLAVEFPVWIGDAGEGVAREVSSSSLLVDTMMPLKQGDSVMVEIGWGESPICFTAIAGRHRSSDFGQRTVVFHVPEDATEEREALARLVSKIYELQQFLGESSSAAEESPATGSSLEGGIESRYRLDKYIGIWGVGEVYEATHLELQRSVTIKILRQELVKSHLARARFEQEARLASDLDCPGAVDIIDFGRDREGGLFYTMEALAGETLADMLESGRRLDLQDTTRLGVHLATTIAIAHQQRIGHLDLRPDNIFLQRWSGTSVWPMMINLACWAPRESLSDRHPLGLAYWPSGEAEAPGGSIFDIYALGELLETLCTEDSEAVSAGGGEGAEGSQESTTKTRSLSTILARARSLLTADRFFDMSEMAMDLGRCLDILQAVAPWHHQPFIEAPPDPEKVFSGELLSLKAQSIRAQMEAGQSTIPGGDSQDPHQPLLKQEEEDPGLRPEGPQDSVPLQALSQSPARAMRASLPGRRRETGPLRPRADTAPLPAFLEPRFQGRESIWRMTLSPGRAGLMGLGLVAVTVAMVLLVEHGLSSDSDEGAWAAAEIVAEPLVLVVGTAPTSQASSATDAASTVLPDASVIPPDASVATESSLPVLPPDAAVIKPDAPVAKPDAPAITIDAASIPPDASPVPPDAATPGDISGAQTRPQLLRQAKALSRKGQHQQARLLLERALQLRDTATIRGRLAGALEKMELYAEAIKELNKAAELETDVAWFPFKIGQLYLKLGQRGKACQGFRRSLKIKPDYDFPRINLRKYCRPRAKKP